MKNIFNYFIVSACFLMFSCEAPLDETYDELGIDPNNTDVVVVSDFEYTLVSSDYSIPLKYAENAADSASMKTNKSFSEAQAKKYIPYILDSNFGYLAKSSSAKITYSLYQGNSALVSSFTGASNYALDQEDYESVDESVGLAEFFSPSYKPSDYIPSILEANIHDAVSGDKYAVSYKYSTSDPTFDYENAGDQTVYSEGFTTDISAYSIVDVSGAQNVWTYVIYGDGAAQGSGYSSGNKDNEEWLISNEVDLTSLSEATMTMSHVTRFLAGITISDYLNVYVTDNFTGDISTTNWSTVSFPDWIDGGSSNTFVDVTADLTSFVGKKVKFGFAYKSTTAAAPRWQLGEIKITAPGTVEVIADAPITKVDYYAYSDAGWKIESGVYYLLAADYDEMGAPGAYDNFSSSVPADSYLPTFLKGKYPYAFEEDQIVVVYKYYSSSAGAVQTRGNQYTYLNGSWVGYSSVVPTVLTFGYSGEAWIPDNTIKYTFVSSDYKAVAANTSLGNETARGNLNTYGNFNTNSGYWTNNDIIAAINFILKGMNPTAEEGQKYLITVNTYPGGDMVFSLILTNGEYIINAQ